MQVQTHFVFDNAGEYANFCRHMATFVSNAAPQKAVDAVTPATEPKKSTVADKAVQPDTAGDKKIQAATKKAEPKTPEKKEEVPTTDSEEKKLETEPTYANMKAHVLAVSEKYKTKKPAFEILNKYGHAKVELGMDETHFEEIIADCQASLAA